AGESVAITFERHPLAVLGRRPPVMLTSLDHRLVLLERSGLDAAVVLRFDKAMAEMSPEAFVREILVQRIGSRRLLMGFDSSFGKDALGTAVYLRDHLADLEVREAAPFLLEGGPVSSTQVRNAILKGELDDASRLLGRPVSLYGNVIHGDGRGRTIGFPTANLDLFHSAVPPHGVYAADVHVEARRLPCLVNIGRRPTFMRPDDPTDYSRYFNEQLDKVEVYVHGFEGDLYDRHLEIFLYRKVRDERRFDGVEALIEQIRRDVAELEEWWGAR
ncbi:MAG: bifunctional riboflavin kinase/FMN adenylyltransferase, partial [Planctomycetes bacterium]|nr:bifunctional riboflavin kinase/FMN adenylyltransferase [Planctomycetota bacterium]